MKVPDEIDDVYAAIARDIWEDLRTTDFHNGRNKIAAALRSSADRIYRSIAAGGK